MTTLIEVTSSYLTAGTDFDTRKKYIRESAVVTAFSIVIGPTMAAAVTTVTDFFGNSQPSINWKYQCGTYTTRKLIENLTGAPTVPAPSLSNSTTVVDL